MYSNKYIVDVVTDASGNASFFTPIVNGRIQNILYIKDGSVPFSNGVSFNVQLEDTLQNLWVQAAVNASATVSPRQPTHDTSGSALLYAAAGSAVEDFIFSAGDRVKIGITLGGNATKGRFIVIVG